MAIKDMKTLTLEGSEDIYKIGSASIYNVYFTTDENMSNVTSDKTVAEIAAAYNNGQLVIGLMTVPDSSAALILPITAADEQMVMFSRAYGNGVVNITGVDGSALELESDLWDIVPVSLATEEVVDEKIATAIGDVETLLQSI